MALASVTLFLHKDFGLAIEGFPLCHFIFFIFILIYKNHVSGEDLVLFFSSLEFFSDCGSISPCIKPI